MGRRSEMRQEISLSVEALSVQSSDAPRASVLCIWFTVFGDRSGSLGESQSADRRARCPGFYNLTTRTITAFIVHKAVY